MSRVHLCHIFLFLCSHVMSFVPFLKRAKLFYTGLFPTMNCNFGRDCPRASVLKAAVLQFYWLFFKLRAQFFFLYHLIVLLVQYIIKVQLNSHEFVNRNSISVRYQWRYFSESLRLDWQKGQTSSPLSKHIQKVMSGVWYFPDEVANAQPPKYIFMVVSWL